MLFIPVPCFVCRMAHITKVEIFGFKSFGFRNTVMQFDTGLVSIYGPNGSGKSSILDAITFATGETRPYLMGVPKMQHLIHEGGGHDPKRIPQMARVSLHFDNSDRSIPVTSDNVVVTRELDSDGKQTYYLNSKKDSRAHIVDMLDAVSAGPGSKTINVVQHGMTTRIAEYGPVERRRIIEDLIGISSFYEKTEAAQEQLEKAEFKLEVSLACTSEVKKRIGKISLACTSEVKKRIDELEEGLSLKMQSERNSILRLISKLEQDKRQTFLDAFETVDKEIRRIFNKITGGGSAWLELQSENDIFSSGISYMVQFPDKQPCESTSINGGEKTLASIAFVWGLQKLQTSPFYLFDEIDVCLDTSSAEKISNILAERSRDNQVVVVSQKNSVAEKAGLIYVVSSQENTSNVVMYKGRRPPF